ncbi:MAG: lipoate--protein ligase family protein [Anaerolineae bacterium]|nr:lipoate--protein ligase family protein [Anaerolineae bacterium]
MSSPRLPLYALGPVSWAESQAIYHAQAHLGLFGANVLWPTEPYVCIGRFQDLELEVDVSRCTERGLPIVRREVGGGAVYLDAGQVFYQLVLPYDRASLDYRALFRLGLDGVVLALGRLGVEAHVRGTNDVAVGGRKISGNGAGVVGQAAVVVGNILLDFDYHAMASVLRVPDEKFRDKAYRGMRENLISLADLNPTVTQHEVARELTRALVETLQHAFRLEPGERLPAEVTEAVPGTIERLTHYEWLHQVRRVRERRRLRLREGAELRENVWKAPGGLLRCHCALEDGRLTWVSFSGDVFAHPPEALALLARALEGVRAGEVREVAAAFLARSDVVLPGVSPEDVERVVQGSHGRDR